MWNFEIINSIQLEIWKWKTELIVIPCLDFGYFEKGKGRNLENLTFLKRNPLDLKFRKKDIWQTELNIREYVRRGYQEGWNLCSLDNNLTEMSLEPGAKKMTSITFLGQCLKIIQEDKCGKMCTKVISAPLLYLLGWEIVPAPAEKRTIRTWGACHQIRQGLIFRTIFLRNKVDGNLQVVKTTPLHTYRISNV